MVPLAPSGKKIYSRHQILDCSLRNLQSHRHTWLSKHIIDFNVLHLPLDFRTRHVRHIWRPVCIQRSTYAEGRGRTPHAPERSAQKPRKVGTPPIYRNIQSPVIHCLHVNTQASVDFSSTVTCDTYSVCWEASAFTAFVMKSRKYWMSLSEALQWWGISTFTQDFAVKKGPRKVNRPSSPKLNNLNIKLFTGLTLFRSGHTISV